MRKVFLPIIVLCLTSCTLGPSPVGPTQGPLATGQAALPTATQPVGSVPSTSGSPTPAGPRKPRGIYAEIHIDLLIEEQQKRNPSITPDQIHTFLTDLYGHLLENPALSGLAIGVEWRRLNPNPPSTAQSYDWSYLDDAFASVAAWDAKNPSAAPKTVQIQVSSGFATPQWVLDAIPSCDGLFHSPPQTPTKDCGKATFLGFVEGGGGVLPMPWNAYYKKSFKTFLTAFAARYGSNPSFVSIDISGPTAASTEMILPSNVTAPPQSGFGNLAPNDMWLRLLSFAFPGKPAYAKSDQAFVDEWDQAIDLFGGIFSGMTLATSTGSGLPNLSDSGFTVPEAFKPDCPVPDMDCAAETAILSHFANPSVGGNNAKAAQSSGMKAFGRGKVFNLGEHGIAWLVQATANQPSPSGRVLGGQQFAMSAALDPVEEGCTSVFPPHPRGEAIGRTNASSVPVTDIPTACLAPGVTTSDLASYSQFSEVPSKDLLSPEQALYNVLRVYFDGTPAAANFGGTPGTATYNYLQIYNQDVTYAAAHAQAPATVVRTDGSTFSASAQDLLNLASQALLQMATP